MKLYVLPTVVFILFSLALYPQQCVLIENGVPYGTTSVNADVVVDICDLTWQHEPDMKEFLMATGKIKVSVEPKSCILGHSCEIEAQLLLMRGNTILACYHPPRIKGLHRAEISFEHTFEVYDSHAGTGSLTDVYLKSRVYVYADFEKYGYGDSKVKYTEECKRYNPHPIANLSTN